MDSLFKPMEKRKLMIPFSSYGLLKNVITNIAMNSNFSKA